MFFGSGDRDSLRQITDQLNKITTELAAVRQQVADQQHTIDQIRQDTTAAINTGLAEVRAVARDALARTNETATGPLAHIGNELVAVRGAISQLEGQLRTVARPVDAPAPDPASAPVENTPLEPAEAERPQPEPSQSPAAIEEPPDLIVLRAAAGISAANLQAHRDTWAFLVKHASSDPHFHIPGDVTDAADIVNVRISGPSIVAALIRLDQVGRADLSPVTRAIAGHLYDRLAGAVQEIIENPDHRIEAEPVKITIDDRARPASDEQ
ncbi:hypothetical protein [Streptomyces sp. NPDC056291]|uniref:hypothetical protein n=1 Tax=Streptomyces sp. NPDC056291 TaxID=3345772 RepID=UPI0035DEF8F6